MTTGSDLLALSPVMPVVVIDDADDAVPTARALLAGGIGVIELTLRTPAALAAIERVATEVPDIVIGAGTVTSPGQAKQAADAGAKFLVTPGCTDAVVDACFESGLPFLPGASTVSEAMKLAERGLTALKFFPAEASGGVAYLKSIAGPLPSLKFCPTGGITVASAPTYLALPNVGCIGGSWLTSSLDVSTIEKLAAEAAKL
ncbi:bifunctional 4-hydroxy-2-oxoglutarate aldolase/2-dehydro-3-deoxy-phosphogluconate aldolase [Amycolatopsis sp. NBC_01286]|uniref:bifunctional 4-hydroxy-2-oxoglutarate aldolase/2-dehydro-3-deoxy-phosphogluconate aldolase n=1 Tax=Amycolatopsis sp. NBC_01286 TaxID=2903560 RepID=UPI002E167A92|nr:bifunctional 4-hydroxy-2-oxoglutarate aldolase/2-dehydro-3-deoxy-phosphogluconate aldolase [Amycolatopsis sp. NBC_01286]